MNDAAVAGIRADRYRWLQLVREDHVACGDWAGVAELDAVLHERSDSYDGGRVADNEGGVGLRCQSRSTELNCLDVGACAGICGRVRSVAGRGIIVKKHLGVHGAGRAGSEDDAKSAGCASRHAHGENPEGCSIAGNDLVGEFVSGAIGEGNIRDQQRSRAGVGEIELQRLWNAFGNSAVTEADLAELRKRAARGHGHAVQHGGKAGRIADEHVRAAVAIHVNGF